MQIKRSPANKGFTLADRCVPETTPNVFWDAGHTCVALGVRWVQDTTRQERCEYDWNVELTPPDIEELLRKLSTELIKADAPKLHGALKHSLPHLLRLAAFAAGYELTPIK